MAVVAAVLWFSLPWTADLALQYWASTAGLIDPRIQIGHIGLRQAELGQVRFGLATAAGQAEVTLEDVAVNYSLQQPALEMVNVNQATIKWHESPRLAGAEPLSVPMVLPFDRISIQHLALDIETSFGRSTFAGRADIRPGQDGGLEVLLDDEVQQLRLTLARSGDEAEVIVSRPAGTKVMAIDARDLRKQTRHASLQAEPEALRAWLVEGSTWLPDEIRSFRAGSWLSVGGLNMAGLRLEATAETATGDLPAKLSGRLRRPNGEPLLAVNVRIPTGGPLDMQARLDAQATELFAMIPPVGRGILHGWQTKAGVVQGEARLRWRSGVWSGSAEIQGSHWVVNLGSLGFRNADFAVSLTDIASTDAEFSGRVPVLQWAGDLAASNLTLRGRYRPSELVLEHGSLLMFGGTVEVVPTKFDPGKRPVEVVLRVEAMDLSQLLETFKLEGLSGTGRISGELPLSIAADHFEIRDGELAGTIDGVLRYHGPIAESNQAAFEALSDLAYHTLEATVNYRPDGEYHLGLRLEGENPRFLNGHPLSFNLNLTGRLPALLRANLMSADFDRSLLHQWQENPKLEAGVFPQARQQHTETLAPAPRRSP